MVAIARRSPVVLFGAVLSLLAPFVHALPASGGEDNCVHLTGYAGPAQNASARIAARPLGGNGGQIAAGICAVDNARANGALPLKTNADFVPVTGDDALGFYCVYGVKASTSGGVGGNVGIFLFELMGGEVLVYGSGYGNIPGANLFDAAYDMERVDQVIRFCMGRVPAQTPLRLLAPHGHGDHINPACNRELERLGYPIVEIAFHPGDFPIINGMAWTPADRTLFRALPAGTTCLQELTSYASPLGKLWAFERPGHTDGSIDLVLDVQDDVTNRIVVRGSQPSSPCAPLPGQREILDAHGNVELLTTPPTLDDVTPLVGSALGGTLLTLTGADFTAPGAGTPRVLIDGTPATEVLVTSDTSLTCKTPPGPPGELVEVAVVTNNGQAVYAGQYFFNALPTLTSVLPTSGDWRGGTVAQIRGTGFFLSTGINEIFFGAKKATNLSVKSDTLLTCRVPSGTPGTRVSVLLRNPNGSASLLNAFSYSSDLVITAIDPPSAPALGGTSVLLTGTSFTGNGADPAVTFGGVPAGLVALLSDTTVLAVVPPGAPGAIVDVVLTNSVGTATFTGFRYHALPRITSVVPPSGREEGGTLVTLNGTGFLVDGAGTNLVRFGGAPAQQVTVVSDTSLRCLTPPGAQGAVVNVTVTNQNGTAALTQAFSYTGPMEVTSLAPASGNASGGTLVTIAGAGFVDGPAGPNTVSFGGVAATQIVAVDNNTLTCRTPAGTPLAVVAVQVTNANGTVTLPAAYRYHALPTLTSLAPNHGHAGTQTPVTITGTGFLVDSPGTNVILVGGIAATNVQVLSNTSILCNFPAGNPGATVDVSLTNANSGATLPASFRYHTRPTLTSLTPQSGGASLQPRITLTGTGLLNDQAGTPTITFGGLAASSVSVASDLSVLCNAPIGTPGQTVDVVLTNARGSATLARAYRFHARPTLSAVTPAVGTSLGGTQVTLTGTGFQVDAAGTNAVSFGGVPALQVTVLDDATLRCLTPPGVEGALVGVTVTNLNGTAARPQAFTYVGPMVVTSVSPASGNASGGTLVTIAGASFVDGPAGPNTVRFGSVAATQIVVVDNNTLTCRTPAGTPLSVVDLEVTNANGTVTLPAAYRYHVRPTLTAVSPNHGHAGALTPVSLTGSGLLADSAGTNVILVGGVPATNVQVLSNTSLLCTFPAGNPGATVDVVLTNSNGSATLAAAFRYHTPPGLTSLSPTSGGANAQLRITLLGSGFSNDLAGTPTITFGGLVASSVSVVNDQTVRCNAPAGQSGQTVDVILTNARGSASLLGAYRFHARPSVTSVTPAVGTSQGGTQVTLTGTGFQVDGAGFNVVSFGGSFAGNVVVLSDTTVQCVTPPGVQDAVVDVVLSNSNGSATLVGGFAYSVSPPIVLGLTPASGPAHAPGSAQITGSGFVRNGAGTNAVRFGSASSGIVGVIDDTRLSCLVPPGTPGTSVDVVVSNGNGTNQLTRGFRYHALPALNAISPTTGSAAGGATMQLSGKGFLSDSAGPNSVTFSGAPAMDVTVVSDTLLSCTVPAGAGGASVEVRVSNANGQTSSRSFAYHARPNLLALTPPSGPLIGGTRVTLAGLGFLNNGAGANAVNFGRRGAPNVVVLSDTELTCETPSGDAGFVNVVVTNANGASTLENGFHYGKLPAAISTVEPSDGPARGQTLVTIKGRGFTGGTGTNRILFGTAQSSSVITVDDETILCLSAPGKPGTTVDVTLENGKKLVTLASAFRYHALPTLASISPPQGEALEETRVTLTGTGFTTDSPGVTEVFFGGLRGREVLVHNDNRVTCKVIGGGPGALLDVRVSNANGAATLTDAYRVIGGPPSILALTPRAGPFLGGTSVVIDGSGFSAGSARVTFGGVPALDLVVSNDTRLVCVTPPGTQGESVTVLLSTKNGSVNKVGGFSYEGIRPELTGIAPIHGPASGGTRVTLTGRAFTAIGAGVMRVSFDGVAATSVVVVGDGSLTCNAPAGLSGKSVDVQIANDNGVATLLQAFRYHAVPTLTASAPAFGPAAGGTVVTLTGSGFAIDGPGPNLVFFGTQAAGSVTVLSNTRLTCAAPSGQANTTVDVSLTNLNGSVVLPAGFGYRVPPQIGTISPVRGPSTGGTALTITGTGFQSAFTGINRVTIGGVPALGVVTLGDTSITCTTPSSVSAGPADVALTNDAGSDVEPGAFLYFVPPTLSGIVPASGPAQGGTQVTLTGRGFLEPGAGTTIVRFGGVLALAVITQSDTTLTCTTPPGSAGAQVDVTLANQNGAAALAGAFRYHGAPVVEGVTPAHGPQSGLQVTLAGRGFLANEPGTNAVAFGGVAATQVVVLSDTTLTCRAPAGSPATSVDVSLTNANGSSTRLGAFRYHAAPALASVAPGRGPAAGGTSVTLTGTGFLLDDAGTTQVIIGGFGASSVVVVNDTLLTCLTPGGHPDARVNVVVANANGSATLVDGFRYNPAPTLTALLPVRGPALGGTTVTLTGSGFVLGSPGPNTVLFGAVPATGVNALNDTTLTCVTPPGTLGASVDVSLRNANGTATVTAGFRYTPLPALTALDPVHGSALGGTQVTLTGSNFADATAGVTTVRFGGVAASAVLVLDDQRVQCAAPAGLAGAVVDVQFQNENGSAALPAAFRYHGAPSLSAVLPGRGSSAENTSVTLSGSGFLADDAGALTVLFGTVPALSVSVVGDASLTCVVAPQAAGTVVDVNVANANGSAFLAQAFAFETPLSLTSVIPASGTAAGGDTLTLTGGGFLANGAGVNTITFAGIPATNVSVQSDTTLTCRVPAGAAGSQVTVGLANANGSAQLFAGYRYHALPVITSVSPLGGTSLGGTLVTVRGAGFLNDAAGTIVVKFADRLATSVGVFEDGRLTCRAPSGPAGTSVTLTLTSANGEVQLVSGYRYNQRPTVTAVTPPSGTAQGGNTVTLTGSGFLSDGAAQNAVTFGSITASNVVVRNNTTIDCTVPPGTSGLAVQVSVNNVNGAGSLPNGYRYHARPRLTSVTPASGPRAGGTLVTVRGGGFQVDSPGTNRITFGGVQASAVSVIDDTRLTCVTPAGAAPGAVDVVLNNNNGADALPAGFTYAAPLVVAALPTKGTTQGSTPVTLTGTSFVPGMTVNFGQQPASNVVVIDESTLECLTPPGPTGAWVDVAVSTSGGDACLPLGFLYVAPPTLTSIEPSVGLPQGGTMVVLSGSGFLAHEAGENRVTFAGRAAPSVSVLDDQHLVVEVPSGEVLTEAEVEIVNDNGAVRLARGFRWQMLLATDVNGDGRGDLILGSPSDDTQARDAGAVRVFLGTPLPLGDRVSSGADLLFLPEQVATSFGMPVAAGDLDGDGDAELLIGAPLDDQGAADAGAVFVFTGPLGSSPTALSLAQAASRLSGSAASERFGAALCLRDLDRNGVLDLLVGATGGTGAVHVYLGGAQGLSTQPALVLPGPAANERFGYSLAAGDLDSDGWTDLAVGAPNMPGSSTSRQGSVRVYRGGPTLFDSVPWLSFTGQEIGEGFATDLATGDVTADGYEDLLVGSPWTSRSGLQSGAIFAFFGGSDLVGGSASLAQAILAAEGPGDLFGYALATGDVDGDGRTDLLTGAPHQGVSGRAYLFRGSAAFADRGAAEADVVLQAEAGTQSEFGRKVALIDVDGDGLEDMVVTAPRLDASSVDVGRVYVFGASTSPTRQAENDDATLTGSAPGEEFGRATSGDH